MGKRLTEADHQHTLTVWKQAGYSELGAAKIEGKARESFRRRIRAAQVWQKTEDGKQWSKANAIDTGPKLPEVQIKHLTAQLNEATRKIAEIERNNLRAEQVREYIFGLTTHQPEPPDWVNDRERNSYTHGIPSLFLSDIHYGEIVYPQHVFGCNSYNSEVAIRRIKRTIDTTIHLSFDVLKDPKFPGIVLCLGGDNINGTIHDDLQVGSDKLVMQQAIEVADALHSAILKLIRVYGRALVVGVAGNHGRDTRKPWSKFYAETNFDWLVYQMLERFLKREIEEGKVAFCTPPARDVTFRIAGRAFRLTHGDQFRGGDSIIGPLGPITRGDNKKRTMALSLPTDSEEYDTLLVAHFHSLYMTPRLIINGAVKGYDEFALGNNFSYEPPQQAFWLTHEKYGLNHYMPVLADNPKEPAKNVPWVEFPKNQSADNGHTKWGLGQ